MSQDHDDILLSVLIPSLPERLALLQPLALKLNEQAAGRPVELLIFTDNRVWPLGAKRNLMMHVCAGQFITHLDDDDDVTDDYVDCIVANLQEYPDTDVLCFSSRANLGDNLPFTVRTGLDFENEQTNVQKVLDAEGKETDVDYRPDVQRKPWHWCAWRRELARQGSFPEEFYGEDWKWLQQVIPLCHKEVRLDRVLHYYFYRKDVSLS